MATKIISQAIIRTPDDPAVQLSIVKAEIDRQNAQRDAQQAALVQSIRKDIRANTEYMQQVTKSRNRLLAERSAAMKRRGWKDAVVGTAATIGKPLLVAWAAFWLIGEQLGLWILDRGAPHTRRLQTLTPRGVRAWFACGTAATVWTWYIGIAKLVAYIHLTNS